MITTSRADYSSLRPVIQRLASSASCDPVIIASGTHLSSAHGATIWEIEEDGYDIAAKVPLDMERDDAFAVGRSMAQATEGFAEVFSRMELDIVVLLGDRFEMHASAVAALPFLLPVAHLHGGELSQGSIDDSFRHSITKLSHLHFAATKTYARRIAQMGEEDWRITVSGAPSLDNLNDLQLLSKHALEQIVGLSLTRDPLLITYHPATAEQTESDIGQLIEALENWPGPIVFTSPNADIGNTAIRTAIAQFIDGKADRVLVSDLGPAAYFSLMSIAAAMVGNSSSGLLEAPSFSLPVVNVGTRQDGRLRASNVIDTILDSNAISLALSRATDPSFRKKLEGIPNPFGDGRASERIVQRLEHEDLGVALTKKGFVDLGRCSD